MIGLKLLFKCKLSERNDKRKITHFLAKLLNTN